MSAPEPQPVLPHEEPLPPRVDLWTAAVFFAVGVAIVYASWVMPTFREQLGEVYTAPGLVPALYGIVLAVLALWLAARSIGRGALKRGAKIARAPREGYSNLRLVLAAALCFVFAVVLVGRLPFWLATAVFVFLFILLFEWRKEQAWRERAMRIATAALIGGGTGAAVMLVFTRVFLVRLP